MTKNLSAGINAGIEEVNNAFQELDCTNSPFYQRKIETLNITRLNSLKPIQSQEPNLSCEKQFKYHLGIFVSVIKNKEILKKAEVIAN